MLFGRSVEPETLFQKRNFHIQADLGIERLSFLSIIEVRTINDNHCLYSYNKYMRIQVIGFQLVVLHLLGVLAFCDETFGNQCSMYLLLSPSLTLASIVLLYELVDLWLTRYTFISTYNTW